MIPIFLRLSDPTFQNLSKQKVQAIAAGGTVGLSEWIIDGTLCLVIIASNINHPFKF